MNRDQINKMDLKSKVNLILDTVRSFFDFESLYQLFEISLFKALVETHFTKVCRGKAIDMLNPR